jgi:hypothetical protein
MKRFIQSIARSTSSNNKHHGPGGVHRVHSGDEEQDPTTTTKGHSNHYAKDNNGIPSGGNSNHSHRQRRSITFGMMGSGQQNGRSVTAADNHPSNHRNFTTNSNSFHHDNKYDNGINDNNKDEFDEDDGMMNDNNHITTNNDFYSDDEFWNIPDDIYGAAEKTKVQSYTSVVDENGRKTTTTTVHIAAPTPISPTAAMIIGANDEPPQRPLQRPGASTSPLSLSSPSPIQPSYPQNSNQNNTNAIASSTAVVDNDRIAALMKSKGTTEITRVLVKKFIADIWNRGEIDLIPDICSPSLRFNGNTGT